jgi:hypothetical protein
MAEAATVARPKATTNDHCGDCPGRHACPALQESAYNDFEYSNARTPVLLSPVAAALELKLLTRAQDRLAARIEGLREQTIANLKRGERIPWFRVEQGVGRRTWNIPNEQVAALGGMFGVNLTKPGIVTPKQAQKLGVLEMIVEANSFVPLTAVKLVAENPADAPRTFGRMEE